MGARSSPVCRLNKTAEGLLLDELCCGFDRPVLADSGLSRHSAVIGRRMTRYAAVQLRLPRLSSMKIRCRADTRSMSFRSRSRRWCGAPMTPTCLTVVKLVIQYEGRTTATYSHIDQW